MKRLLPSAILLLIIWAALTFQDYKHSYSDISLAINKYEKSEGYRMKTLIGGQAFGQEAVYFYLNDRDRIVGVELEKGMFGWKVSGMSTGTGMGLAETGLAPLSGGVIHNGRVMFGLATLDKLDRVVVNGKDAALLSLEAKLDDKGAEGRYAWAVVFDDAQPSFKQEVLDKDNRIK
ncbi:hypothetical protein [Paenibacillus sp. MBLB4367]|uniref:hypothetical protein n=1 Tax=Paenibacillus sp. MBLB4367 TaxID=3384767 RepID=UPI0039081663